MFSGLLGRFRVSEWISRIGLYGRMVKFSHTVFALPFALSAVVLASRNHPVTVRDLFWILVAMVGARSAAMGCNRIIDASMDGRNPRTSNREIPAGRLSISAAKTFVVFFSGLFVLASGMLGRICLVLSLPVLAVLIGYSYAKRFTWLAHLILGFAISLAPLGAWVAIAKNLSWPVGFLSLSLLTYIAGFDILYACQDTEFDRDMGLLSIPARFGNRAAMQVAALIHAFSYAFLLALYVIFDMGGVFLFTVGVIGFLLLLEHSLVDPLDLTRINLAFFDVNSIISILLFLGVLADELMRRV